MSLEIYNITGHLARRLHQVSTSIFQDHMKQNGYDFTSIQFTALNAIASNPNIDQASLAKIIAYDKATIGGVIDRLEKKELIKRSVSRTDRRAHEIALTAKGNYTLETLIEIVKRLEVEILRDLSDDEKTNFLKLATKITERYA